MNLLILNGIPDGDNWKSTESHLEKSIMQNSTMNIEYFRLRDMKIRYCTGCWHCWWKTPGICSVKDEFDQVLSRIPHADKMLFVSPVISGYESALLKKCKDRSIPNLHPYSRLVSKETHHRLRYKKMPSIEALIIRDEKTTEQEVCNIRATYHRFGLNFGGEVKRFDVLEKGENYVFDHS